MYRLSSSLDDRANYDEATERYLDDAIASYIGAGGRIEDMEPALFWDQTADEDEQVDDIDEARAGFEAVFAMLVERRGEV